MRALCLGLLLAATIFYAVAHVQAIHSHLLVEAGQQFVLGGNQAGAFRVSARNGGPVPVLLLERLPNRPARARGRLEPGQAARLDFAAGAAVLVRNLGRQRAELDLDVRGGSNGKMTYEPGTAD